ncbi:3-hydroxyacyl-ACP dehydratase FabZ family protein [Pedobacter boryungensis]|uniref:Beta-hydroxyacyl-ACP dehydratase n=1 Tax=Pedobacter boryungensis TaxID=869962 RepID=A0ABX2DFJ4_9SPHI|nr:3-hydroxyacyl-ACP dehydratase FabZ family protein [Pedobacter boryungensis]NQX32572.1 beta-hydroxyacyl-ACP dehydratase [Pedobacter boryungensis]
MNAQQILEKLPYSKPFLFVDELLHIDENGVKGTYTYAEELDFYKGHFRDFPITPGVILTETMAQIGLVCLGIYLLGDQNTHAKTAVVMTSNHIDFLKPVFPLEKVIVTSEKVYFRFNKLSCNVKMENEAGEIVCKGTIAGMITEKSHE